MAKKVIYAIFDNNDNSVVSVFNTKKEANAFVRTLSNKKRCSIISSKLFTIDQQKQVIDFLTGKKTVKLSKDETRLEKLYSMFSDCRGDDNENVVALSKAIDIIQNSKVLGCEDFGMISGCRLCEKCSDTVKKVCRFVHEADFLNIDDDIDDNIDDTIKSNITPVFDGEVLDDDNEDDYTIDDYMVDENVLLLGDENATDFIKGKTTKEILDMATKMYHISVSNRKQPYGAVVLLFQNGMVSKQIVSFLAGTGSDSEVKKVKGFVSKVSCIVKTFINGGSGKKVSQACDAIIQGLALPEDCKSFGTNIKGVYEFFDNANYRVWARNEQKRKNVIKGMKRERKQDSKIIKLTA